MMKGLKHTPGPWKVWGNGDLYLTISPDKASVSDICHLHLPSHEKELEENYANGKLITAAPEMIEILIEIYKAQYDKGSSLANLNGVISNSKNIIEKATGLSIKEAVSE